MRAKGGASDLVQETFLEAQRNFAQFRGKSRGEFRLWLRQILLHNLRRFHEPVSRYGETGRGAGSRVGGGGLAGRAGLRRGGSLGVVAERKVVAREEAEASRPALAKLPDDYRRAITLRLDKSLTFPARAGAWSHGRGGPEDLGAGDGKPSPSVGERSMIELPDGSVEEEYIAGLPPTTMRCRRGDGRISRKRGPRCRRSCASGWSSLAAGASSCGRPGRFWVTVRSRTVR